MASERRFPERPSIPPALYALVITILIERQILGRGSVTLGYWGVAVGACLSCCVTWWRQRTAECEVPWFGTFACCVMAGVSALVVAAVTVLVCSRFTAAMRASSVSSWTFEVTSDATATDYGYRCRAHARKRGVASGDVWLNTKAELKYGELAQGVGRFRVCGDDDWGRSSRRQGIWGTVMLVRVTWHDQAAGPLSVIRLWREHIEETICPSNSDGRAVLASCITGDRRQMAARGLDVLFSACGVAHLVAVSGSHLSIVSALLSYVLVRSRLRPMARLAILALLTGLFVMTCGSPPSAVRAWLMTVVAAGSVLVGRRSDGLSAISLVALTMALIDPGVSGQLGYVLSVVCVIGLALFSRYVAYAVDLLVPRPWLPRTVSAEFRIKLMKARRNGVDSLAVCLVAQAVTLPLVGSVFGKISLIGPIAMLVVGLPFTGVLWCGLMAAVLSPLPILARIPLWVADMLLALVLHVLRLLSRLPMAAVAVSADGLTIGLLVMLCCVAILVLWPVPSRRALVMSAGVVAFVFCAAVIKWRYLAPARVCVLDVGQGDAILVQDGRAAILVDTGPPGVLAQALAREHVLHVDAIVLTHLHDDHYGGVGDLVGITGCERVLVATGVSEHVPDELGQAVMQLTGAPCEEIGYGDLLRVGGFELRVVWPRMRVTGLENPDSLELVVEYQRGAKHLCGLLTGDGEAEETGSVIQAGDVSDVDFLKVGHHGSEVSLSQEDAEVLSPEVAVASAGAGNVYGHPRQECIDVLESVGAQFLCTKDLGDIEIRPSRHGPLLSHRGQSPT